MRTLVIIGIAVAILLSTWLFYSKRVQNRRESAYRVAIAPFQRDLRTGMSKADVKNYLHKRNVEYHPVSFEEHTETYEVEIGEEPGSLVCDPWKVYIAMEFDSSETLREVHIRRIGTCL